MRRQAKATVLAALLATALGACNGDKQNPFQGGDDGTGGDTGGDPSTSNAFFLYDETRGLTMNQFTYDPATDTIQINNLPFDGASSSGGTFDDTGIVLPDGGMLFANVPNPNEDQYYAVLVVSPDGTGALAGAVGTNAWLDFGYGGAYAERPSAGMPASQVNTYGYDGPYGGIRILRQGGGATNVLQLVSGDIHIDVDVQNLEEDGSIRGIVSGRSVYDTDGTYLGDLAPVVLNSGPIDAANAQATDITAQNYNDEDGSAAQSGTWSGYFSGPNGEEIVGFLIIEGEVPDSDPFAPGEGEEAVTGREIGGFVAVQED